MKKAIKFAIFFLCLLILTGCGVGRGDSPDPKKAFSLHLSGTWEGEAFEADIVSVPLPDGTRQGRVTYTSPDALAGIVVTVTGDTLRAACGDVSMEGDAVWGLGLPLWAFLWDYTGLQSDVREGVCTVYETAPEGYRRLVLSGGVPVSIEATLRGLSFRADIEKWAV